MTNLYLNGEYLPLEQGHVPVEDRGFQFGDGVYEVIRVYHGKPFGLGKHLARLGPSVKGLEEATIYLQVTRGSAPRVHAFPRDIRPTFVAYARAATRPPDDKAYTLKTVPDDRWGRCHL